MRRRLVWATLAFIALSALAHVLIGGSVRLRWPAPTPARGPQVITLTQLIRRMPPSPAPSPTPTPQPVVVPQPRVRASPARRPVASRVVPSQPVISAAAATEPAVVRSAMTAASPPAQPALPNIEPNPTPIDARDIIVSARFTRRVDPEYPAFAADAGIQGTVIVLVTVAPDGSASDFRVWVSSGNPVLDRAALVAAERSTYAPPQVEGLPAYETYRIIESFEKL